MQRQGRTLLDQVRAHPLARGGDLAASVVDDLKTALDETAEAVRRAMRG